MREIVVGFDTRVRPERLPALWTPERREQFLLRVDTTPLSVDEAVWVREGVDLEHFRTEAPKFDRLEDALAAASPEEVVVAFTTWAGGSEPDLLWGRTVVPAEPEPAWQRLGWDVADGFFPSGLTNCGYGDEVEAWRADWADALDEHHLFQDLPTVFAFRDATDRRVREHGPFAVVGVYVVPAVARASVPAR